jgi:hypothetical protein
MLKLLYPLRFSLLSRLMDSGVNAGTHIPQATRLVVQPVERQLSWPTVAASVLDLMSLAPCVFLLPGVVSTPCAAVLAVGPRAA